MSVSADFDAGSKSTRIKLYGRFDFGCHQQFRQAYEGSPGKGGRYVVDLGQTEYMDSSALGMLLMLREYAGGESSDVRITNPREEIMKVLQIANFQKLFRIG